MHPKNDGRYRLFQFNALALLPDSNPEALAGRCKWPATDTALQGNTAPAAALQNQTGFHNRAETCLRSRQVAAGRHFSFIPFIKEDTLKHNY
ncbi:hypothetical protein LL912_25745 [Niabella sp. CC-SYL272]|uniref:hypothetical protein n=1 Tax=Niabella agricola TaxID=2891571 RepID=UPI001F20CA4F|nr:hypothetical protein [Niabella agricola]MCF3112218.1 hypothetical protein [Niabella agricola]